MSVVAVKIDKGKKIELCSDSFVGGQYDQQKVSFVKSFQSNGMTLGGVGSTTEMSLMKIFCKSHNPKHAEEDDVTDFFVEFYDWCKKRDSNFKIENQWIFIYRKKVFTVDGLDVRVIKDHYAIGAGKWFANAVLHVGHTVQDAVRIACELSPWCEQPINTFTIDL